MRKFTIAALLIGLVSVVAFADANPDLIYNPDDGTLTMDWDGAALDPTYPGFSNYAIQPAGGNLFNMANFSPAWVGGSSLASYNAADLLEIIGSGPNPAFPNPTLQATNYDTFVPLGPPFDTWYPNRGTVTNWSIGAIMPLGLTQAEFEGFFNYTGGVVDAKWGTLVDGGTVNEGGVFDLIYLGEPIPEPATMSLLGLGAVALIRRRRA